MKKFHVFLVCLFFSGGLLAQNLSISSVHSHASKAPNSPATLVIINYDGDNFNSVGDGGITVIGGARFRSDITGPLTGGELQFVQFHYTQAATGITIKVYDAGTATEPGTLLVDQPLDLGTLSVADWNEVELSSYVPITGGDLWICLEVADATAASFPFGIDDGSAYDSDGDWVNDTGVWQHLADFGIPNNWNIRGVVEDSPGGTVSIAYAIEDLDGDYVPDHLGDTVTVQGVVFSPNYQTTNNSFYIWDEVTGSGPGLSRGTDIFMFGPTVFNWNPGDLLEITGAVDQFNGMTEIIPFDSSGWVFVSSGNPTP